MMMDHLVKSELAQREVAERERLADVAAKGHWPAQKRILADPDNWPYQKAVGLRNYHQTMVHLYAAVIAAHNTTVLAAAAESTATPPVYLPPPPRRAGPPDTRTPGL